MWRKLQWGIPLLITAVFVGYSLLPETLVAKASFSLFPELTFENQLFGCIAEEKQADAVSRTEKYIPLWQGKIKPEVVAEKLLKYERFDGYTFKCHLVGHSLGEMIYHQSDKDIYQAL